jgi:hypothetical protein
MNTLELEEAEKLSGHERVLTTLSNYYKAEAPSYRDFWRLREDRAERRHSGMLRGFLSVNPFGSRVKNKKWIPGTSGEAIRDDWFMAGKDLYTAILEYRLSKRSSARPTENESESAR